MSYANIITQEPRTIRLPGGVYGDTDYHGSPPWGVAYAAGWRMLDARPDYTPPEGEHVVGYTYAQDPARPDYATETPITAAIPVLFPSPDITVPVLDAAGAQTGTARLLVDATGTLVIVTDSASPQRPVADQLADFVAVSGSQGAAVDAMKALKDGMVATITAAQAAKSAAQAVDQTAFTGGQRTQFQALRQATIDVSNATIDAARAANDLRKALLKLYKQEEVA
jgi:hypothetical protein